MAKNIIIVLLLVTLTGVVLAWKYGEAIPGMHYLSTKPCSGVGPDGGGAMLHPDCEGEKSLFADYDDLKDRNLEMKKQEMPCPLLGPDGTLAVQTPECERELGEKGVIQ